MPDCAREGGCGVRGRRVRTSALRGAAACMAQGGGRGMQCEGAGRVGTRRGCFLGPRGAAPVRALEQKSPAQHRARSQVAGVSGGPCRPPRVPPRLSRCATATAAPLAAVQLARTRCCHPACAAPLDAVTPARPTVNASKQACGPQIVAWACSGGVACVYMAQEDAGTCRQRGSVSLWSLMLVSGAGGVMCVLREVQGQAMAGRVCWQGYDGAGAARGRRPSRRRTWHGSARARRRPRRWPRRRAARRRCATPRAAASCPTMP